MNHVGTRQPTGAAQMACSVTGFSGTVHIPARGEYVRCGIM